MTSFFTKITPKTIKGYITKYWRHYLTIFLVMFSISYSIVKINESFTGGHLDGINARQGTWNENFIQNGYLKTKFGEPISFEKDERCIKGYYFHHPSFGVILYSLPNLLMGNKEWSIRIVPLLFFLFNLFLLYKIVKYIFNKEMGLIAVIIYSFLPVNRIYSTLSDFYGPLFFTYTFLIIYFILKYDHEQKAKYEIAFFVIYFLSLLHDWFSIINIFIILFYYLFFKREKIYKGLFFLITLTNIAFLLNFLHIYSLTGSFMVNELIGQFKYRSGGINLIIPIFFRYQFEKAFGLVAIGAAIGGIFVLPKVRNKKFKLLLYSQTVSSLFFLIFLKQALSIHWFLFMNFSLFITLAILSILEFCKKKRNFVFKLLLPAILFSIILSSQFVVNEYKHEGVHSRGKFENWPLFEYTNNYVSQYTLVTKFLETEKYDEEKTLVLLRNPGYYIADYYLGINSYCFDAIGNGNPYQYNNLKGFESMIFIELDENNNLKIEKIK